MVLFRRSVLDSSRPMGPETVVVLVGRSSGDSRPDPGRGNVLLDMIKFGPGLPGNTRVPPIGPREPVEGPSGVPEGKEGDRPNTPSLKGCLSFLRESDPLEVGVEGGVTTVGVRRGDVPPREVVVRDSHR